MKSNTVMLGGQGMMVIVGFFPFSSGWGEVVAGGRGRREIEPRQNAISQKNNQYLRAQEER